MPHATPAGPHRTCMNLMRRCVSSACTLAAAWRCMRASRFQNSSLRFTSCVGEGAGRGTEAACMLWRAQAAAVKCL